MERDFYVRQLWDGKGSVIVEGMLPYALASYAEVCGQVLARAHARSGDPVAIASYLGRATRSTAHWPTSRSSTRSRTSSTTPR